MFDEASMAKWCNGLKGYDKEFVKWFLKNVREHDETKTFKEALIDARMALILRKAIGIIGYAKLKTPREVYKELTGS